MEHLHAHKDALLTERTRLITELENLAVHNSETDDWHIKTDEDARDEADENVVADAAEQADTDVSMLAELENQYRHIQIALEKITQGTYGTCEIGGEAIDEARLQILPAARTCRAHMEQESQLPI